MSVLDVVVCKIICSRLERSAAFYERWGFTPPRTTIDPVVPQRDGRFVSPDGFNVQLAQFVKKQA